MFYTLGLKELPFEQDVHQIIYVDGQGNMAVSNLIMQNYSNICSYYKSKGYDFCYIPMLKKELSESESFYYSAPYAKCGEEKKIEDDNFILGYMLHPENRKSIQPSLLFFHPLCINQKYPEAKTQFRGITISESSFEGDNELKGVLSRILDFINEQRGPGIRFQKVPDVQFSISDEDENNLLYRDDSSLDDDSSEEEPIDRTNMWASEPFYADEEFDEESKVLMREVEERIDKLKQKGISAYILKKLLLGEKKRLSRLRITKDYRIFLPDYNNIEIKMTPLPKSVFLLFLNHPNGIMFSYLPDYREELMDIYKKVKGPFFNTESAKRSVEDVTDPLKNSINENCSRIRESFVSQFEEYLAHFYYVDGERGEAKKISLPRDLVVWE